MCNECLEQEVIPSSQINTEDVFFGKCPDDKLDNLDIQAGVDLTSILKRIDYYFNNNENTLSFSSLNVPYLEISYPINNFRQFIEACDLEFIKINNKITTNTSNITNLNSYYNTLSQNFQTVKYPNIVDSGNVGFVNSDSINTVLQKIVNRFNTIQVQPINNSLSSVETNSFKFNLSGSNNNILKGDVKISNHPNNKLQSFNDGLYVNQNVNNQTLSIRNNTLSISDGNSVNLPVSGFQRLSINNNNLTISDGNTISLPLFTESNLIVNTTNSIVFNQSGNTGHNISANVKLSSNTQNKLEILSDGLFVKMDADQVVNQILADPFLQNSLCNILSNCVSNTDCYKWFIRNKGTVAFTISYVDVNNNTQSLTISSNTSQTINGIRINTNPSLDLDIVFLGKC